MINNFLRGFVAIKENLTVSNGKNGRARKTQEIAKRIKR